MRSDRDYVYRYLRLGIGFFKWFFPLWLIFIVIVFFNIKSDIKSTENKIREKKENLHKEMVQRLDDFQKSRNNFDEEWESRRESFKKGWEISEKWGQENIKYWSK